MSGAEADLPAGTGAAAGADLPAGAALFGYASRFSIAAGQTISFHVSGENVDGYQADLVRLRHGYDGPGAPGLREQEIRAEFTGTYPAQHHPARPGSYVEIPDRSGALRPKDGFELVVPVYPTAPGSGLQGLAGRWCVAEQAGFALALDGGVATLLLGDGDPGRTVRLASPGPLATHAWYLITAGWDAAAESAWLRVQRCRSRSDRVLPAAAGMPGEGSAEVRSAAPSRLACPAPFRIGALSERADGEWVACAHFNGKIGGIRARLARDGVVTDATWDFGVSRRPGGLLLDEVADTSGSGLDGYTVNQPTRAVTGHLWTGQTEDFRQAPAEYDAIHLHDDDVGDLGWPAAFTFTAPPGLPSGVYAARLRGPGAAEHIPFFVSSVAGQARNAVAVLFPTGSYLAYANDRLPFDAPGAELLIGHVPVLHADDMALQRHYDFGHSCYEVHSDGSGVVFSSRRRPILTMRPGYRAWFMADGFWQFPADLAIVDWLEHEGIGWDAITDEDLHREGAGLLAGYRVVLTGSHPEYVSARELDALESYVSSGGRLMYLGGNGFYWLVSYHPDKPYLMEVRRSANGSRPHQAWPGELHHATTGERGGLWRDKGRPPQRLTGVGFTAEGFDRSTYYERLPDSFADRAAFIFAGVGADERIGDFGIMGGGAAGAEIDRYEAALGSPPGALLLASSGPLSDDYQRASEELLETPPTTGGTRDPDVRSDLVYFTLDGGGAVFSVGSIAWTGCLSHNAYRNNVATITGNVLRRFAGL